MFIGICGHVPWLGEQSPRRPPLHAAGGSVCRSPQGFLGGGGPRQRRLMVSLVRGFLSLGPPGSVRRRCGRRAVVRDRIRRSAAATLDACRAFSRITECQNEEIQ
ncbi:unnamed protein product [Pleuronectes platessa]|uniref:Uncharacterized protein n=1 Tax=Pleuronectes platessa TaxID=8262 RepID=A0A9N7Y065_PLEPL|nr:unnamed protein product [Pleuronectes platessa]